MDKSLPLSTMYNKLKKIKYSADRNAAKATYMLPREKVNASSEHYVDDPATKHSNFSKKACGNYSNPYPQLSSGQSAMETTDRYPRLTL